MFLNISIKILYGELTGGNMFEELQRIQYYRFNIYMTTTDNALMSEWLGSAVRGAFGTELIKLCCIDGKVKCESCSEIFSSCSAKTLFHTGSPSESSQAVNPYIIYCEKYCYRDNVLTFELTLFGNGVYTVKDVFKVLAKGLKIGRNRTFFKLTQIIDAETGEAVYDGVFWKEPQIHSFSLTEKSADNIRIDFMSPFVAKQNNIQFEYIIRAILRRASTIMTQCGNEFNWDFNRLIQNAKRVKLVSENVEKLTLTRYSNRAEKKMNISGIVGQAVYSGDIKEFIPLIMFAEKFHVGKLCVMGLGKIKVN